MRLVAVAGLEDHSRLSFLHFQIKRSTDLANEIVTPVLYREERILCHRLKGLITQHSELSQRLDYNHRTRTLVVTVFDLCRDAQALRPLLRWLDARCVNTLGTNLRNQAAR